MNEPFRFEGSSTAVSMIWATWKKGPTCAGGRSARCDDVLLGNQQHMAREQGPVVEEGHGAFSPPDDFGGNLPGMMSQNTQVIQVID